MVTASKKAQPDEWACAQEGRWSLEWWPSEFLEKWLWTWRCDQNQLGCCCRGPEALPSPVALESPAAGERLSFWGGKR